MKSKTPSEDLDFLNTVNHICRKSHCKSPLSQSSSNFRSSSQIFNNIPVKLQLSKYINTPSTTSSFVPDKTFRYPLTPVKPIKPISSSTSPTTGLKKHKVHSAQTSLNNTGTSSPCYEKKIVYRKSSSQSDLKTINSYQFQKKLITTSSSMKNIIKSNINYDKIINVSELILLEERLNDIINSIYSKQKDNGICNACFEWWSFYFSSSLCEKYKMFFTSSQNKVIVGSANNLELFAIMLTYDISNKSSFLNAFRVVLKTIYLSIKNNFLLIIKRIISVISYTKENKVYIDSLMQLLKQNQIGNINEESIVILIKENSTTIVDYIKIILLQYSNMKHKLSSHLTSLFNNISKIDNCTLNTFFFDKIVVSLNTNRSITNSLSIMKKYQNKTVSTPYIKTPQVKPYTLVLDIDETMICFKFKSNTDNSGTLYLRPGLVQCLRELRKYYELISFTAATKEYAEPLLKAIESREKLFDYKFYREHAIVIGKDFVKDISRIGREMKRIVIVDNMSMNYRLNKENGILIYPYYYPDKSDTALIELKNILMRIAREDYEDIRDGLFRYRNEITMKVSSNNKM